jgi:hypothetical protein
VTGNAVAISIPAPFTAFEQLERLWIFQFTSLIRNVKGEFTLLIPEFGLRLPCRVVGSEWVLNLSILCEPNDGCGENVERPQR